MVCLARVTLIAAMFAVAANMARATDQPVLPRPAGGWLAWRLSAITGAEIECSPTVQRPFYALAADTIHLPAAYCRVLVGPRVDWVTAYVTFNLAHELGHRVSPGCVTSGTECESDADCYAAGHLRPLARLLERTAGETRYMVRSARAAPGFGYRPIPPQCWR